MKELAIDTTCFGFRLGSPPGARSSNCLAPRLNARKAPTPEQSAGTILHLLLFFSSSPPRPARKSRAASRGMMQGRLLKKVAFDSTSPSLLHRGGLTELERKTSSAQLRYAKVEDLREREEGKTPSTNAENSTNPKLPPKLLLSNKGRTLNHLHASQCKRWRRERPGLGGFGG